MENKYEIIYAILNYGAGSKFLLKAKEHGVTGGTIYHGRGTLNNKLLNFFSLYDERKEIVMLGASAKVAEEALDKLAVEFKLDKPNKGIAFTTRLDQVSGSTMINENRYYQGDNNSMYKLIITIVNRDKAEDVVDAASEKGAKGATIINARGSGTHETAKIFSMNIEPEKEMVYVIVEEDKVDDIVENIHDKLHLEKPGNGIIFVQDLNKVYGLFEAEK